MCECAFARAYYFWWRKEWRKILKKKKEKETDTHSPFGRHFIWFRFVGVWFCWNIFHSPVDYNVADLFAVCTKHSLNAAQNRFSLVQCNCIMSIDQLPCQSLVTLYGFGNCFAFASHTCMWHAETFCVLLLLMMFISQFLLQLYRFDFWLHWLLFNCSAKSICFFVFVFFFFYLCMCVCLSSPLVVFSFSQME